MKIHMSQAELMIAVEFYLNERVMHGIKIHSIESDKQIGPRKINDCLHVNVLTDDVDNTVVDLKSQAEQQ